MLALSVRAAALAPRSVVVVPLAFQQQSQLAGHLNNAATRSSSSSRRLQQCMRHPQQQRPVSSWRRAAEGRHQGESEQQQQQQEPEAAGTAAQAAADSAAPDDGPGTGAASSSSSSSSAGAAPAVVAVEAAGPSSATPGSSTQQQQREPGSTGSVLEAMKLEFMAGVGGANADVPTAVPSAAAAATAAGDPSGGAGAGAGGSPGVLRALATLIKVLGDTVRVLLRLLLVEPLSWVLNRSGLLAVRAADVISQLEKANQVAPLEPDRLAAALHILNKHHPQATVEFVERRCLKAGMAAAAEGEGKSNDFAVNAAVVREYLTALVQTGRLAQFGDNPNAAPAEGQSHRSLPQLLADLQQVARGQQLAGAPGATLAQPLHVIVQPLEKAGGAVSWISSFLWSCIGMCAVMYVMTVGAASMRRVQGGASAMPTGMPGGASVAASSGGSSMFAAKEYSKENLPEKSVKRFKDVKGCDEAIGELQEIVEYLKHPDKFTRLGGKLPKGVLLTGPPGTGKTLLARAVAGEAGVPFFYKAGSEFDEMFVGVGSRRVRSLFAAAKKKAPCIIFIDEIDAMGGKRSNWESSGGSRKTLNQLLTDMDGFEENSGVVVMAATNLPELLDTALTRPGRFDRQVAVTLPDVKGRQQILDLYLTGKPVDANVDTELLARRTPGFSGAELANLVNESALLAARYDADSISLNLLDEARDKVLMGTPRALTQSEEARRLTAYHEGGHALVALHTRGAKPIHKATIVPRGHALGMVSQLPDKDEYSTTRQQMRAHIDVCMGGKAAEELIFGEDHVTSGATSDLKQATRMARYMVVDCGMSARIGPVAVGGQDQSPATRQAVDDEVQSMLKAAYERVASLLKEKEQELHVLAAALLQNETLTLAEIQALVASVSSPELPGGSLGQLDEAAGGSVGGSGAVAVPAPAPAAAAAAAAASVAIGLSK